MITLNLTKDEATLVLGALKNAEQLMRGDTRHDEDRIRVETVVIRLEAEIKIERRRSER